MRSEGIGSYEEAIEYKKQMERLGIVPGLETMRRLAHRIGDPQKALQIVHIAGTNGKGSVLAFLSTALRFGGYRVGGYSSPAVFCERERFRVNGRPISKADYAKGMETVRRAAEQMEKEGFPHPTAFEAETALAFWYFKEKECNIVVLETGLGGLLDATNIIDAPVLSVLTAIGRDHMGILGDSLPEIAAQKAGIIKEGRPVVCAPQQPEVLAVIEAACAEKGAALHKVEPEAVKKARYGLTKQSFSYKGLEKLEISLAGGWQIENAALSVQALMTLGELGYPVSQRMLRRGLLETKWPGRFTVIDRKPLFLIDGAHNEGAARKLRESVIFHFTSRRIIIIIGVLKDKEYEKTAGLVTPLAEQVITVTPPAGKRALAAFELAGVVKAYNQNVTAADSLEEAVEMAYLLADAGSVILACGSLSYLGALSKIVKRKALIRRDTHGRSKED